MRQGTRSNESDPRRAIFLRSLKNQLFTAQRRRCAYCGRTHRIAYLEIDHKYPKSRGGNEIDNLQLLCTRCNMRKGILSDAEFRRRYGRLLPADGSIPSPPISQEDFSDETQYTRAPREVRAIYAKRFANARRAKQQQPAGCAIPLAGVALALLALALRLQTQGTSTSTRPDTQRSARRCGELARRGSASSANAS